MQTVQLIKLNNFRAYLVAGLICVFGFVHADDWQDKLSFNAYYSLDSTWVDDDLNLTSSSSNIRNHKKNQIDFDNSIFGAQFKYDFTDNFSAFVQGSLTQDNRNSVVSKIDWAYLSYDFGHDLKARVGKFQMPLLSGIELRKVGYSRLWVRPLIPGNGASGYDSFEGVDVIKSIASDHANWDFQLAAGEGDHGLDQVHNKNIKLMSVRYQRDNYWVRAALMGTSYSLFTPRGVLITDSGESLLASIESEINIKKFQINVGVSSSDAEVVPDDAMAYLSLAYRFEKLTPYIYGVKLKQHFPFFTPPMSAGPPPGPPSGLPPGPPPLRRIGNNNSYNLAIGVRWDIKPKLALKFQLENVRVQDETRTQTGIISTDGNALTLSLDGVF